MKNWSVRALLLLLCALIMGLNGCSGVTVGTNEAAGTYNYVTNSLQVDYDAPLSRVWPATLAAVKQLNLETDVKNHDGLGGLINGTMADGKTFSVKLDRKSAKLTTVTVRVGTFGNMDKSKAIHETILARVKKR